jgi:hypothetical protein
VVLQGVDPRRGVASEAPRAPQGQKLPRRDSWTSTDLLALMRDSSFVSTRAGKHSAWRRRRSRRPGQAVQFGESTTTTTLDKTIGHGFFVRAAAAAATAAAGDVAVSVCGHVAVVDVVV